MPTGIENRFSSPTHVGLKLEKVAYKCPPPVVYELELYLL